MVISAHKQRPGLKIIGFCYGHQAIAKYFGGKVEAKPLVAGIERIFFTEKASQDYEFLKLLEEESNQPHYLVEYHRDNVTVNP